MASQLNMVCHDYRIHCLDSDRKGWRGNIYCVCTLLDNWNSRIKDSLTIRSK